MKIIEKFSIVEVFYLIKLTFYYKRSFNQALNNLFIRQHGR